MSFLSHARVRTGPSATAGVPTPVAPSVTAAVPAPAVPTAAAAPGSRLRWVDAVRGVCVVFVVIYHMGLKTYEPFRDSMWDPAEFGWFVFNALLDAFRMPLLLAVSGMLVARRIREGWGKPGALVRAASTYYLYVVWLAIHFVILLALGMSTPEDRTAVGAPSVLEFAVPLRTTLWYVYALSVYVVVFTTIRRVRGRIVLPVLFLLGVVLVAYAPSGVPYIKVAVCAVWFGLGVYGGPWLGRLGDRGRFRDIAIAAVAGAALTGLGKIGLPDLANAFLFQASGLAFIVLGCITVAKLVNWAPFGRLAVHVGRRTLQIYVLHIPLYAVVAALIGGDRIGAALTSPVVAVGWPLLLTVLFIVLSLWIRTGLEKVGLGVLFAMPAGITSRIEGAYTRRAERRAAARPAPAVPPPAEAPQP